MTHGSKTLQSNLVSRTALDHEKQFTDTTTILPCNANLAPSGTLQAWPGKCDLHNSLGTQSSRVPAIARSFYNHCFNSDTLIYSPACVCLPHCSLLDSRLGAAPQTLLPLFSDNVKQDRMTPGCSSQIDVSVESYTAEPSRNPRKTLRPISGLTQERKAASDRLLGGWEKDSIVHLSNPSNVPLFLHKLGMTPNTGRASKGYIETNSLGQSTIFQKPRELSVIRGKCTEEDVLTFFDLTCSKRAASISTGGDSSIDLLTKKNVKTLFSENNLPVVNAALAVSFNRDGAKRRIPNSCLPLRPS